jgi:hypothetical protein
MHTYLRSIWPKILQSTLQLGLIKHKHHYDNEAYITMMTLHVYTKHNCILF